MEPDSQVAALDEMIAKIEKQVADAQAALTAATTLRYFLANASVTVKQSSPVPSAPRKMSVVGKSIDATLGAGGKTQLDKVDQFFASNGNSPASALEIMAATGIQRGSISNLLYSNRDHFDCIAHPEHGRWKLWRLQTNNVRPAEDGKTKAENSLYDDI